MAESLVDSKDLSSAVTLVGWKAGYLAAHLVASKVAKSAATKAAYLVDSSAVVSAAPTVGL